MCTWLSEHPKFHSLIPVTVNLDRKVVLHFSIISGAGYARVERGKGGKRKGFPCRPLVFIFNFLVSTTNSCIIIVIYFGCVIEINERWYGARLSVSFT